MTFSVEPTSKGVALHMTLGPVEIDVRCPFGSWTGKDAPQQLGSETEARPILAGNSLLVPGRKRPIKIGSEETLRTLRVFGSSDIKAFTEAEVRRRDGGDEPGRELRRLLKRHPELAEWIHPPDEYGQGWHVDIDWSEDQ